jgi:hypothetical protein
MQVFRLRFSAHGGDVDRVAVLLEMSRTRFGAFVAHDIQPSVRAFGHPSGRAKTMLPDDHVYRLDAKRVGAPQHRARVVRVGDAVQHQHQAIGSAPHDFFDPF